jgi:hypothetical protein
MARAANVSREVAARKAREALRNGNLQEIVACRSRLLKIERRVARYQIFDAVPAGPWYQHRIAPNDASPSTVNSGHSDNLRLYELSRADQYSLQRLYGGGSLRNCDPTSVSRLRQLGLIEGKDGRERLSPLGSALMDFAHTHTHTHK